MGNRNFVEYMCTFEGSVDPGFRIIRWNDNSIFNMAHTFGAGYPTVKAHRWYCDHTKKSHKTEIDMPNAIAHKNMGGIDIMDHLLHYTNANLKSGDGL